MDFLQKNARAIVIALLVVGVITAISVAGSEEGEDETNNEAVVSQEEGEENNDGDVAEGEEASDEGTEQSDESKNGEENDDEEVREERVVEDEENYTGTAQAGDNQTLLVREILNRFMANQDSELSAEQMLFAETNLVNELPRDDLIYVGDTVQLSKTTVEETVEAARNLSEEQVAAWAAYL